MKYSPQKVFILRDNRYIELSYEEFCKYTDESGGKGKNKYFLPIHGMLMEVPENVYREFYKNQRWQRYLDERSAPNGDFSYDMLTTDDFNGADILVDETQDAGETAVNKIMLDKLKETIYALSEEEQLLIYRYYYEEIPKSS